MMPSDCHMSPFDDRLKSARGRFRFPQIPPAGVMHCQRNISAGSGYLFVKFQWYLRHSLCKFCALLVNINVEIYATEENVLIEANKNSGT